MRNLCVVVASTCSILIFFSHRKLKIVIRHLNSSVVTTSLLLTTKTEGLSIFDPRFTITTHFPPRQDDVVVYDVPVDRFKLTWQAR